jgi:hypothetical protein
VPAVSTGVLPHALQKMAPASARTAKNRMRKAIESPNYVEFL